MRAWLGMALVMGLSGALHAGCAARRCDTWSGAACGATGTPATAASPLRLYALGDAGRTGDERAASLELLKQVLASEPAGTTRVLAVLGNNIYERGMLSGDAELGAAKEFYAALFGAAEWRTVAVVPGNYDHGAFRHGGFDAKAIAAEAAWFRQLRADVVFPEAADPRNDSPWLSVAVPGLERCVTLQATDSQGYRENLLALPAPKSESAWNLALAHHPTRTAANHMGDRHRDEYQEYAKALAAVDLLLAGHENVLFADLAPRDADRPGPPNIVSGAFAKGQRLKSPERTRCASELPGFVRLSVQGDALVADFFSVSPAGGAPTPYCTQAIEKAGSGAQCGAAGATAAVEAAAPAESAPAAAEAAAPTNDPSAETKPVEASEVPTTP